MLYAFFNYYDVNIFLWFNSLPHYPVTDTFIIWMHYGTRNALIYFVVFIILFIFIRKNSHIIIVALSMLMANGVTSVALKPLFHRTRPYIELSNVVTLPPLPITFSFPSGEVTGAFAVTTACVLLFEDKRWNILWLWAILVAFNRMYMGHHFPSDIIAGAFVGFIVSYCTIAIIKYYTSRSESKLTRRQNRD